MYRYVALTVSILALGACSTAPEPAGPVEHVPELSFAQQVDQAIDDAKVGGASENQLTALEQAKHDGELTFEAAKAAMVSTVDCIAAAGVDVEYSETARGGRTTPGYIAHVGTDDDGTRMQVVESCDVRENFWINWLYASQPSAQEAYDSYLLDHEDEFIACVKEAGVQIDDNPTADQLNEAGMDALRESDGSTDCFAVVGL